MTTPTKCCEKCLTAKAGGAKYACGVCPCHTTPIQEDWEGRFDARFPKNYQIPIDEIGVSVLIPSIKGFIRTELARERQVGRDEAVDYLKEQARYYKSSIQAEFVAKEEQGARTN